ncbi:hypothetical protein M409DRAFT_25967 [Zasmidium cellare ATCC 36951]|uniref:Uncharacterized protein n=1 Tax=Zasmidium cellare ATCC 36951 TaxID=1080233 RepID=A0A6A6C9T4_ZASCE|nr:uncharacterized protein M409DRAFT_25967 [Zasmidium cellare ATCC 36951]KAF2163785.1 hypothetical protein M409DRAFT_25967 [Zasmidium cellare ATCC 36951]
MCSQASPTTTSVQHIATDVQCPLMHFHIVLVVFTDITSDCIGSELSAHHTTTTPSFLFSTGSVSSKHLKTTTPSTMPSMAQYKRYSARVFDSFNSTATVTVTAPPAPSIPLRSPFDEAVRISKVSAQAFETQASWLHHAPPSFRISSASIKTS